ncbi:hypothetical protein CU041_16580 [Thalassospira povalilytica]|uniref:Transglutaminase-like domain-containing protein n=2 Tax=Thalassospira povalilytica TaxID=732237 RepID=A0ABX4R5C6_9PROT|nr:hypothetical protein CU041_16580 [Thalassospira povalilytica]
MLGSLSLLSRRYLFALGFIMALLLLCAALFGYIAHKNNWPAQAHEYFSGITPACCLDRVLPKLQLQEGAETFEKIDAVRNFVFQNSMHADHDFDQTPHPYDTGGVIRALIDASDGNRHPMALMCSSRSNAMTGILDQMGYSSRQVHVFAPVSSSHTFLEVQSPEDGKWYIQDPDYNLFWMKAETGERLGLGEMLSTPLEEVLPCKAEGDCDWEYAKPIANSFGAGIYFNFNATPLIVINKDRFDLDTRLEYISPPGTITEFAERTWGKDYGEPIVSVISGGK